MQALNSTAEHDGLLNWIISFFLEGVIIKVWLHWTVFCFYVFAGCQFFWFFSFSVFRYFRFCFYSFCFYSFSVFRVFTSNASFLISASSQSLRTEKTFFWSKHLGWIVASVSHFFTFSSLRVFSFSGFSFAIFFYFSVFQFSIFSSLTPVEPCPSFSMELIGKHKTKNCPMEPVLNTWSERFLIVWCIMNHTLSQLI